MLKKFLLILVFGLLILCLFNLCKSNIDLIDYQTLQLRNNYYSVYEEFPEHKSEMVEFYRLSKESNLEIDLSGKYFRNTISNEDIELIDDIMPDTDKPYYVWSREKAQDDSEISICFINDSSMLILVNRIYVQQMYINYDNAELMLIDEFENIDVYRCKFFYYSEKREENNLANKEKETLVAHELEFEIPEDAEPEDSLFEKAVKILIELVFEHLLEAIGIFLLSLFVFYSVSIQIKKIYKKNLKLLLFPKEHSWFGNNSPDDVYVSVQIFEKEKYNEYNLIDYFSKAFINKATTHALLGNAGEGKTFSLSRITYGVLECFNYNKSKNKREYRLLKKLIPVILNFSELSECKNQDDLIENIFNKIYNVLGKRNLLFCLQKKRVLSYINTLLIKGRFVILFDGYDEISNTDLRLAFSRVAMDFMNGFNKCHYVVTSRIPIYTEEKFDNVDIKNTLYLSPLSKEQVREFIMKWEFPDNKSGTELYQRILNTVQLENMVTNPLLLTMITHVYSTNEFIFSNSKVKLYRQCCECLLKKWEDKKRKIKRLKRYSTLDNVDLKLDLLSLTANHLYIHQTSYIKEGELLELWSKHYAEPIHYKGKSKYVLMDMIEQSGILERTNENIIRFRHRSFYEFFLAAFFAKHSSDFDKIYFENKNEKNILFFYLALIQNDLVVEKFVLNYSDEIELIQDVLIERNIINDKIVLGVITNLINKVNFNNLINVQALGYIAKKYPAVDDVIRSELLNRINSSNDERIKINIIITLMIFCDTPFLTTVLKQYIKEFDLYYLVKYTGDAINDLSPVIIDLLGNNGAKISFVEQLAKTYWFEAIYNIYIKSNDYKELSIIGLLYMCSDPLFLNWLKSKNFNKTVSNRFLVKAKTLNEEYGWLDNNMSEEDISNFFLLIYLAKEAIKKGNYVNKRILDNKIAFLICCIISKETDSVFCDLIDINGLKVKDNIELIYHWNKRKRIQKRLSFNNVVEIPVLNRIIFLVILFSMFLQALYFLSMVTEISLISFKGWDINFGILSKLSLLPFNSVFFIFSSLMFLLNWAINEQIKKLKYNYISIAAAYICGLVLSIIFMICIKNLIFKLIMFISLICVNGLETLKHRNNYPSFKEPQFSKIINYLQ